MGCITKENMFNFIDTDISIGVVWFSDRKKPCLAVQEGNNCTILASFTNDMYAKKFCATFYKICEVTEENK